VANLVVNWRERQQSLDMIEKRANQLLSFATAVKRRDFNGIKRSLGIVKITKKAEAKRAADLFLEFHFGWDPLIQDIGNAVEILQSPLRDKPVKARGKAIRENIVFTRDYGSIVNGHYTSHQSAFIRAITQVTVSATVKVTNPNLYRANQLGFLNPATVAWELVPFSFVVDWFVPVGDFLNSFTEYCGLDFKDPCYFETVKTPAWSSQSWYDPTPGKFASQTFTGFWGKRILGIPSVNLNHRRYSGLSPTRAATAISLLLQGLRNV
jgi:hypothetical protein